MLFDINKLLNFKLKITITQCKNFYDKFLISVVFLTFQVCLPLGKLNFIFNVNGFTYLKKKLYFSKNKIVFRYNQKYLTNVLVDINKFTYLKEKCQNKSNKIMLCDVNKDQTYKFINLFIKEI